MSVASGMWSRGFRRGLPADVGSVGKFALAISLAWILAGCQQDLYSNLTEVDANQMLAILMANGVNTVKSPRGKDGFTLSVDDRDMLRAIAVLKDSGYPKSLRESIGKVFQKSGIMSSPFEERVRYIYALGEDVAQTLSHIDGVVTARVHIVLPDAPQLGQPIKPSSAAVFIKHQPGVDLDYLVPQIKRLVSSAVEGLDYAAVTVVLTEAALTKAVTTKDASGTVEVVPGIAVRDSDVRRFWELLGGTAALAALLSVAATYLYSFLSKRIGKRPIESGSTNVPMVEPS